MPSNRELYGFIWGDCSVSTFKCNPSDHLIRLSVGLGLLLFQLLKVLDSL